MKFGKFEEQNGNIVGMILLFLGAVYPATVLADDVTVPHTFVAGTPASASEVNANFQALVTAINDLQQTLASTTCSSLTSDLDFKLLSFGVGLGAGDSFLHSESGIGEIDACLKADGNLALQGTLEVFTEVNGPQNLAEAIHHEIAETGNDPEGDLVSGTIPYTLNTDCSIVVAASAIDADTDLTVHMNPALTMGVGLLTEKMELCNDGSDCNSGSGADVGDAYFKEMIVMVRKGPGATFCASL